MTERSPTPRSPAEAGTAISALVHDHDRLEEIIDDLNLLLDSSTYNSPLFARTFAHLIDEVRKHFHREETWMKRMGYPALSDHRKQHQLLIEVFEGFLARGRGGFERSHADMIRGFIEEWLVYHMTRVDSNIEVLLRTQPSAEGA